MLSLCFAAIAQAATRPVDTHVFSAVAEPRISVESFIGETRIIPSVEARSVTARVQVEANAKKPENAQRWVDRVEVEFQQSGNAISIAVRFKGAGLTFDLGDAPNGSIRIEVTVPTHASVDLATRIGSINVGNDLRGSVRARLITGTIFCGRIIGSVDAEVEDGDISLSRATGDVTLKALRGDINAGTLFSHAALETSAGSINIFSARAAVSAKATAGDIIATVANQPTSEIELTTSGGNITVKVSPDTACTFDARSRWGKVYTQLPVQTTAGGHGQRTLQGQLNDGGPFVRLNANGGNISIISAPNPIDS